MATITPAGPRTQRLVPTSDSHVTPHSGGLRETAQEWLRHPLASMALVAVPSALLLALGTIMVWSASSVYAQSQFGDPYTFIRRQLIFLVMGLVVVAIVYRIPIDALRRLGWPMFLVSGVLMCLPFVMGARIKGNLNWIDFGPMLRLQPSEIAKAVIILWGASLFTSKRRVLDDPRHLLIPFLPGALLLIALTVLQHDLGTASIMGLILISMLFIVGAPMRLLAGFGAVIALGVVAMVKFADYRVQRVFGFLDPTVDPSGINYQPNQAQYGLAMGGWWGVGLGRSRQKWGSLSEAHTDYVLAIIGEELGLVGTLGVIALFVVLAYAGFRIALRSGSFYARIATAGLTAWLAIQAAVNIAMVLRLLPVLGLPLPLVSYGGSSLVMNMAALGILLRCAREEPKAQQYLAQAKKSRRPRRRPFAVPFGRRT